MSGPTFNNVENEKLQLLNGESVWRSRSLAVVSTIIANVMPETVKNSQTFICLIKRGLESSNEPGKFALPGGYLDWNETIQDCAAREIWEETGINVRSKNLLWRYTEQPWKIDSNPTSDQNVIFYTGFEVWVRSFDDLHKFMKTAHINEGEISEVKWISVRDAITMDLGFDHTDIISEYTRTHKVLTELTVNNEEGQNE